MPENGYKALLEACKADHQRDQADCRRDMDKRMNDLNISIEQRKSVDDRQNDKLETIDSGLKHLNKDVRTLKEETIPALSRRILTSGVIQVVAVGLIIFFMKKLMG